jgi:tRNA (guanine-N7-)-methyltransferase
MTGRIRRHVDPFRCRFIIRPEDWLEFCRAHGQSDIWLDLGCGKGEFLAALAKLHPNLFFIGVEIRGRIAETYFPKFRHLPNLVLLHGNVNLSIPVMMGHLKVQRVFIHFPDPYTRKARYKKRRMMNQGLVQGLCQILAPDAVVSVKTDDKALFEDMDVLISSRLEPNYAPAIPSIETMALTEWENECKIKSFPVYSREYRLRRRLFSKTPEGDCPR